MKTRWFSLLSLVMGLALLLPGGMWPTAAQSQPLAPLDQTPPGDAAVLAPQSDGTWRNYTNGNYVYALAVEGDYVWAGTGGGVVRWNRSDGSYVKYTTTDGLADNRVTAIAVDGAGHKWFGTYSGVSEFDGSTWTTYTTADGLASNYVNAIAVDGAGHLWFGTYGGGASKFDGSTWTTYTTADGLADNRVYAIAVDGAGHLWFGNHDGVSEFDGSAWITYTTADGLADNHVNAITIDGTGHKWFSFGNYGGGVSKFDSSTWTTYTAADGLASNNVYAIAVDGAGHKWFGTRFDGVSEFDGSIWTTYTTADGLADNHVNAIAVDGAGHKWFSFGNYGGGVSEFDSSTWTTYTTADGLASNYVYAIAVDGAGHKWFGFSAWGAGVSEFDGSTWTTYTTADGLAGNTVYPIAVDGAGHMWFGTNGGVSEFDGSTWTTYTTADGLAGSVLAIAVDGAGHLWFGTYGGGVSEFDGSTWTTYTTADGLADNWVYAIAIDGAGHKWFGTYGGGVSEFDGSTWTTYTTADGLADNWVFAIAVDGAGHLWFGTVGDVSEFDGSTWTTYTTADGLASRLVEAIAVDGAGHLWFGTGYGGVSEYDGSTWTTYTTADGLASNYVRAIAVDGAGHLWFGTYGGVSEFIPGGVGPIYSISGRVTDADGDPVPGVTVAAGTGGSASTDANGDYIITGLITGTYTLTPSRSGYTFLPVSRTVSVPPSKTGQDFTGSSSGPSPCEQPVLLVHGWGGPSSDVMTDDEVGFAQLSKWMLADGYVEGCNLFYATGVKASNDRISNATAIQSNLREAYDTVKTLNPGWNGHFDIIGHSYGGLNSRAYLESYLYLRDQREKGIHVDNLFTLGSPHGGAIVPVELFPGAILIGLGHLTNPNEWPSAWDLLADKMNQYNLSHRQPDEVCYRLIGGNFMSQPDLWWKSPQIWRLYLGYILIPNDIGVSRRSSLQLGTNPDLASRYGHVVTYANTDMHGYVDMLGLGAVRSYVSPDLTYNEIIAPNLGADMSQCRSSQVNIRSAVDAQPQELTMPPLLIASDTITGGQTITGTVPVDWDGQTAFYVTWMSGDLDLTLRDPAGVVLTPTVAISDTNADYGKLMFGTSGLATYILTNTLVGEWTYTITAESGPYPIPFDLYVNPDSPLVARASAPEWQPFGAPVVITASLFYSTTPVSAATVQSHITRPDGSKDSISLHDDGLPPDNAGGDGMYSGTYTDTTEGGFYYVLVEADGTYASQTYHRTAQTIFPVAADSATLSNTYAGQPRDDNGDGLYEYLDVSVGVNGTQLGDFTVAAVLQGGDEQYIDLANATVYSSTGDMTLTLRFDGQAIRASGLDGPYTITEVLLLDDAALIKLDEAHNAWVTLPYDHRQFGAWPGLLEITKTVAPQGQVNYGDELTYTLVISAAPGTQVGLYDPLESTNWVRFVERPTDVTHVDTINGTLYLGGVITGTLTVTPTNQITVSFVVQAGAPGTLGWTVDVTNRACVYPFGGTLSGCIWSNEVTNPAFRPHSIYLPVVLRNS